MLPKIEFDIQPEGRFIDDQTFDRILSVRANGVELEEYGDITRQIFLLDYGSITWMVKFDLGGQRLPYDHFTHQSSRELELLNEIEEPDQDYFLPVLGGKIIEPYECGHGYIIQRFYPELITRGLDECYCQEILDIALRYELIDVDPYEEHNCGLIQLDDRMQPVIYDWGL